MGSFPYCLEAWAVLIGFIKVLRIVGLENYPNKVQWEEMEKGI